MYKKLIKFISKIVKNTIPEKYLEQLQENLVQTGIFFKTEEVIALIIFLSLTLSTISLIICLIMNINLIIVLILFLLPPVYAVSRTIHKLEKRKENMEENLPEYLRQLSSLLKIGLGLETALEELVSTNKGPLSDEIRRALIEVSFGKDFNKALLSIGTRIKSDNLTYVFQVIIYSKDSGGNLSQIIEYIAKDQSDMLMLKKDRKSSVMMSVMFLVISTVIATPFAFGMTGLYSTFIESVGKTNPLITILPTISTGYLIINSVLTSLLLGTVMYSNIKKGVKYVLILVPTSLAIYYISQIIMKTMFSI